MHHSVLWGGNPVELTGTELHKGDKAPSDFTVVGTDMKPVKGADLAGKPRIYVTAPSVDTPVCDREIRRFNVEATNIPGVSVVVVTMDLPFAQKRWCGAAGVDKVQPVSDYKDRSFGPAFGVLAGSKGLLARAVFVVDKDDVVQHVEYVKNVGEEPNYDAALEAARGLA